MALPAYLSALREIILDSDHVEAADLQQDALARRFPHLNQSELSDLAEMDPARLRVYTDLIFAGERSTLEYVYPASLAVIHRLRRTAGDEQSPRLADFELVREIHRWRPWRSSSQRELAANLEAFIHARRQEWLLAWAGLADLLDFERTELEVFYAADPPFERVTAAKLNELSNLTVEALLMLRVVVPSYVAFRSYVFNAPAFIARWRKTRELPDPLPIAQSASNQDSPTLRFVCGRDTETLLPCWHRQDAEPGFVFTEIVRDELLLVDDLARRYLAALPADYHRSEELLFAEFFERLAKWFRSGILMLAATSQDRHKSLPPHNTSGGFSVSKP